MTDVVGVHLEIPVRGVPQTQSVAEHGALQLLRAIQRPIIDAGGRYALADATRDGDSLVLDLRARWNDGGPVTAEDVSTALGEARGRLPGVFELVGLAAQIERRDRLRIASRAPRLAADLLGDLRLTPSQRGFTGAFVPRDDGWYHPAHGAGRALRPVVVEDCHAAVEAFARGEIVATCPAMFEIDRLQIPDPARHATDLTMLAWLRPASVLGALPARARAALFGGLAVPPEARGVLAPAGWLETSEHDRAPALRDEPIVIVFGDYWPNRHVASAVRGALIAHGATDVRLDGVSFEELGRRVRAIDFDIALAIHVGQWGIDSLLLALAARIGAVPPPLLRDLDDGSAPARRALRDRVLAALPVAPLFTFNAAMVAAPALRAAPLARGACLRLERLLEQRDEER